jgi:phage repressor protein C with HTH and peptisase S24 domain
MSQGCTASEPYALRVVGDSMLPEFKHGNIIIVDPAYPPCHEAYVVVNYGGEVLFGQFIVKGERRWIHYLNSDDPPLELIPPYEIKGVVIQRSTGRKKGIKHYDYDVKVSD